MDPFFKTLSHQFTEKLPFVAYRKPNEVLVKGVLQSDTVVHTVTDYSERGFVFAPFNTGQRTILIPFENCIETLFNESEKKGGAVNIVYNSEDKKQHIQLVKKGIEVIKNTDLNKVVLSRKVTCSIENNTPIDLFKNALMEYSNAFVYLWYHPEVGCWIGATPEVLLQTRNNQFKTMSLAGTQLYTKDVTWELKEQEEQQIVTDYIAENLSAKGFNFIVGDPYTIKAGHLAHIRSDFTGRIKGASDASDLKKLIDLLHPTPAVCGYPKTKAKNFILDNEGYVRRFYTGFLGELNFKSKRKNNRRNTENSAYRFITESSNLYVNLRCMELHKSNVNIYVGGGVTASSDAEKEYVETCNKMNTMKKLIKY
ncbi:MAG: isochorismate synthase [Kordia sp.]|nr:MAG: isochorismate synthase [Kordia sp.]